MPEDAISPTVIYGELRAIRATVEAHGVEARRLSDLVESGQARQDDRIFLVGQRLGVVEGELQGSSRRSGFVAAAIASGISLLGSLMPHWFIR
ncbi:MAG: hypothetical protein IVW56_09590 [Candidatus Binataceae bacterium]|nr:hypothetical protein [Candidatus Binataceae bacterium]